MNIQISGFSIRTKIILLILTVTLSLEICGAAIILYFDYRNYKKDMIETASMNMRLVAEYSIAPILFDDRNGASTILSRAQAIPSVKAVWLFDTLGKQFASWPLDAPLQNLDPDSIFEYRFSNKLLTTRCSVVNDSHTIGYVQVTVATDQFEQKILDHARATIELLAVLMLLAFLMALRLHRVISQPLTELSNITRQIASKKDLSYRLSTNRSDEIGQLYSNFNTMLAQLDLRQSERDVALDNLQKSDARLRALIDAMPDMVLQIDAQGIIKMCAGNLHQSKLFPRLHADISLPEALPKAIADSLLSHVTQALALGTMQIYEFSNTEIHEIRQYEIRIVKSSAQEAVAVIRDVTESKNITAQLFQAQKMETIGNLAGGLAHDFNNVLGGITGMISLMKISLQEKDRNFEELEDYVNTIDSATHRATDMVTRLLTLSRKHDPILAPIDLRTVVSNVNALCKTTLDKSVELAYTNPQSPAIVYGDLIQLEQVLLNLCVNGAHAMTIMRPVEEHKGGTLRISIQRISAMQLPPAVYRSTDNPSTNFYRVSVIDTGVGIPKNQMEKIFEPFFTTKVERMGTGLGLSMVKSIVGAHNGRFEVESTISVGTAMHIYLPELKDIVTALAPQKTPFNRFEGSATILLVDDEEIIRYTMGKLLEKCGLTVISASGGREAIMLYTEQGKNIDLVILDIAMPRLSGTDVLVALRAIDPQVRVILSSGNQTDPRLEEARTIGISGFIQKPAALDTLIDLISTILISKK